MDEGVNTSNKRLIYGIFFGVLLIALISTVYFYNQYQKSQQLLQNPNIAAQEEIRKLVIQVGRLIELPKNEEPTVATVSDVSKLKGQPFFANAVNGDKVLIYEKAKKAILYRPSINKIIEVGPINIGQPRITPGPTQTKTSPTEKLFPSLSPAVTSPSATPSSK